MKQLLQRIETIADDDQGALTLVMLEDIDKIERLRSEFDPSIEQLDSGHGIELKNGMFNLNFPQSNTLP